MRKKISNCLDLRKLSGTCLLLARNWMVKTHHVFGEVNRSTDWLTNHDFELEFGNCFLFIFYKFKLFIWLAYWNRLLTNEVRNSRNLATFSLCKKLRVDVLK